MRTSSCETVSNFVYRSRAVPSLTERDVQALVRRAQSRNRREALTGVVLYDGDHFFQWLEGPDANLGRVVESIRSDHRHTDLEVLGRHDGVERRFDGWDMKLAGRRADAARWQDDVLDPPDDLLEQLRLQPTAAPDLLVRLVPALAGARPGLALAGRQDSERSIRSLLDDVVHNDVVPRLLRQNAQRPATEPPRVHPRAAELALLLTGADQDAPLELLRELRGRDQNLMRLTESLLEPAARDLGGRWDEDLCSELEVTLGLARLLAAVRVLGTGFPQRSRLDRLPPHVLIAPAPGELHHLTAALDSEWLWQAGWDPQFEIPATDRALEDLVAATWIDVLDLSLSPAFRRDDSLGRLTRSITQARNASRNPGMIVVVGGRAVVENRRVGAFVGADLASITSQNIDRLIRGGFQDAAPPEPASPVAGLKRVTGPNVIAAGPGRSARDARRKPSGRSSGFREARQGSNLGG